jgi:hypothetical protein
MMKRIFLPIEPLLLHSAADEVSVTRVQLDHCMFTVNKRGIFGRDEVQSHTVVPHTAKTQYRKVKTNIPRKGIERPQSQFPQSCVCERFIYSHDRLPILLQESMFRCDSIVTVSSKIAS